MGQGSITRKASDLRPLLLDRFRNAAAAYSLRPLTLSGQDHPVVKVRRSVDDTEQDFNPAQINDGTLEQFVNAGDVAPADYGTGAAAAYSLRHVSDGYTGDVVRVRRSVDNTEQDFNPTEIEDGTLKDWVTALDSPSELITNGTFDSDISGWSQTASGWVYGTNNVTNTTGSNGELLYQSISTVAGQTYLLTFDVVSLSGTLQVSIRDSSVFGTTLAGTDQTTTGSKTYIFTAATTTTVIRFGDYFTSCTLDNISVKEASSGFVTTWYDQSGNSNDATQATAASQPKIVSGGSLVTENGKPAIDFDGVNDGLETPSIYLSGTDKISTHLLTSWDGPNTNVGIILESSLNWNNNSGSFVINTGLTTNGTGDGFCTASRGSASSNANQFAYTQTLAPPQQTLISTYNDISGDLSRIYGNSLLGSTDGIGDKGTGIFGNHALYIGARGASAFFYEGTIQELIIYPSDQSSNRELIETNVNHYYSIYSQTNDGFVTTWYDQSGNGNHATQATAASQPKIVSAGSLVVENGKAALDFDGSDDELIGSVSPFTQCYLAVVTKLKQLNELNFCVIGSFSSGSGSAFGVRETSKLYNYDLSTSLVSSAGQVTVPETILFSSSADSANVFLYKNGIEVSSVSAAPPTNDDVIIGSNGSVANFSILCQEFVLYPSDQSTKRQQIESNINTHYGIY